MKKSNATLAALLFAFGSASTYAAPPQPKPGKNAAESVANMTELVCKEVTSIVADGWGKATAGAVSPHAEKIMAKFPDDPETYAASVMCTKKTYYEVCLRDYPPVLKSAYDDSQKNR